MTDEKIFFVLPQKINDPPSPFNLSESKMEIFDAIVIGSGINGSWAAYQLSKQGQKVLMLEQVFKRLKIMSVIVRFASISRLRFHFNFQILVSNWSFPRKLPWTLEGYQESLSRKVLRRNDERCLPAVGTAGSGFWNHS